MFNIHIFQNMKMTVERASDSELHLGNCSSGIEKVFDNEIKRELQHFYSQLTNFHESHLPTSSHIMPAVGFSSLVKWSHVIYKENEPIGKAVITVKRNGSFKVGPVYIVPKYRGQNYGTRTINILNSVLLDFPQIKMSFATLPESNLAARKMVENAGYMISHVLVKHYNPNADEIVYIFQRHSENNGQEKLFMEMKPQLPRNMTLHNNSLPDEALIEDVERYYFAVDAEWMRWYKNEVLDRTIHYHQKPHKLIYAPQDAAKIMGLLIYKRGGAVKVVLTHRQTGVSEFLDFSDRVLEDVISMAFRKVTFFVPTLTLTNQLQLGLSSAGFQEEATIPRGQYALYDDLKLFSLVIE